MLMDNSFWSSTDVTLKTVILISLDLVFYMFPLGLHRRSPDYYCLIRSNFIPRIYSVFWCHFQRLPARNKWRRDWPFLRLQNALFGVWGDLVERSSSLNEPFRTEQNGGSEVMSEGPIKRHQNNILRERHFPTLPAENLYSFECSKKETGFERHPKILLSLPFFWEMKWSRRRILRRNILWFCFGGALSGRQGNGLLGTYC